MIIRWPDKIEPGQVDRNLVYSIDICATILEVAGIVPTVPLHGKSLFGNEVKGREYVFAARDKMDDAHDAIRSIRSKRHKLILNLMPERAYCQFSHYKEGAYPPLAEMNVLHLEGKLTPAQSAFLASEKPEIELFDLTYDPHEIVNVANDPAYLEVKTTLLAKLNDWRQNVIKDQGVSDEFRAVGIFPEKCPRRLSANGSNKTLRITTSRKTDRLRGFLRARWKNGNEPAPCGNPTSSAAQAKMCLAQVFHSR
jgi:N-sulfoglucosamine sulfohydrolase